MKTNKKSLVHYEFYRERDNNNRNIKHTISHIGIYDVNPNAIISETDKNAPLFSEYMKNI